GLFFLFVWPFLIFPALLYANPLLTAADTALIIHCCLSLPFSQFVILLIYCKIRRWIFGEEVKWKVSYWNSIFFILLASLLKGTEGVQCLNVLLFVQLTLTGFYIC